MLGDMLAGAAVREQSKRRRAGDEEAARTVAGSEIAAIGADQAGHSVNRSCVAAQAIHPSRLGKFLSGPKAR